MGESTQISSESPIGVLQTDVQNLSNIGDTGYTFQTLQFILNCFLHVSILFFFLMMLFIIIIAPIAKKAFKHELGSIINNNIDNAIPVPISLDEISDSKLDEILSHIPSLKSSPFNRTIIKSLIRLSYNSFKNNPYIINNYIKQYSSENSLITKHNNDVVGFGLYLSIVLFIITILLCITLKYFFPDSIDLSKLFVENILTFALIGAGELWFFLTFAKNFIPAPPSLLSKSAIDNIKSTLSSSLPSSLFSPLSSQLSL